MRITALILMGALSTLGVFACGSDDADGDGGGQGGTAAGGTGGSGEDTEGLRMCCELGAICHAVDDFGGPLSECHALGHQNDPAQCRARYDECFEACTLAVAGAGGAGEPHGCAE